MNKFILTFLVLYGCSSHNFTGYTNLNYTMIESELNKIIESTHFIFHLNASETIDTLKFENYLSYLSAQLKIQPKKKIQVYKYRDSKQLKKLTQRSMNAFAESGLEEPVFHTIHSFDNHEMTHTLIDGLPPVLFGEGIAVAYQTRPDRNDFEVRYNDVNIDSVIKKNINLIPNISDLLQLESFRKFDSQLTYPIAGSYLTFLIKNFGIETIKKFCFDARFDDSNEIIDLKFKLHFKITLKESWGNWKSSFID